MNLLISYVYPIAGLAAVLASCASRETSSTVPFLLRTGVEPDGTAPKIPCTFSSVMLRYEEIERTRSPPTLRRERIDMDQFCECVYCPGGCQEIANNGEPEPIAGLMCKVCRRSCGATTKARKRRQARGSMSAPKALPAYDNMALLPRFMAHCVATTTYTGAEWSSRSASEIAGIEALRAAMTPEAIHDFADQADVYCRAAYAVGAEWFVKIVQSSNAGRDQLLFDVLPHWLNAYLVSGRLLRPEEYASFTQK